MLTIDLHTHVLPPPERWTNWQARFGYPGWVALDPIASAAGQSSGCSRCRMLIEGVSFREIESNCWNPPTRLADMARHGVHAQVLSTVPVMFNYWAKPQHSLELSCWLNDHIAELCRDHPDRFIGLGTIPMQAPDLAIRELERCVLELGLRGVQIGTNVNGLDLGHASLRPIFCAAQQLGAAVFVHPWEMLCPPPVDESAVPKRPAMPERFKPHWLAWLVGMPAETGLAIASVLFSGLLDELPRLRIGFAHGGGSFPGTIGRIDHGFHARPDLCQTSTRTSPRDFVARTSDKDELTPARFWVDSLTHDAAALRSLIALMSDQRVMLGSDYPFPLGEERPGELVSTMPDLSAISRARVLSENALEFLGLTPSHALTRHSTT